MTRTTILKSDFALDVIAPAGRIGLIALATDFNSEQDLRRMLPSDIEIFTNRVLNANPVTLDNLRAMSGDITRAAGGILPGLDLDVLIYGCTSGTIAIGVEKIEQLVREAKPGILVSNPVSAALAGLSQLKARRISILTPYSEAVNLEMARYFESQRLEVINISGFNFESDIDMTGIPPKVIKNKAIEVCDENADCLFISCTAMRSSVVLEEIEQTIGKPVISSNQALVWHSLKLLKYSDGISGFGSLLDTDLGT